MPHPIQNPDNLLRLGANLERETTENFLCCIANREVGGLGSSTSTRVINVAVAVAADDVAAAG